jgi:tetratricopeptide (TPR) repeat protein
VIIYSISENDVRHSFEIGKGHQAFIEKSWNVAIFAFDKAILLNPNYTEAYFNGGNAYAELGNYNQTIADYNKTIDLDPKDADPYNTGAITYLRHGDNISGCRDAQKACDLGNCNGLDAAKAEGFCH